MAHRENKGPRLNSLSQERMARFREDKKKPVSSTHSSKTEAPYRPRISSVDSKSSSASGQSLEAKDSLQGINQNSQLLSRSTKASRLRVLANSTEGTKQKSVKEITLSNTSRPVADVVKNFNKVVENSNAKAKVQESKNIKNIFPTNSSTESESTVRAKNSSSNRPFTEHNLEKFVKDNQLEKNTSKAMALRRPEIPKVLQQKREEAKNESTHENGFKNALKNHGASESISNAGDDTFYSVGSNPDSDSSFLTPLCDSVFEFPTSMKEEVPVSLPSTAAAKPSASPSFNPIPLPKEEGGVKAKTKFWSALTSSTTNKTASSSSFTPHNGSLQKDTTKVFSSDQQSLSSILKKRSTKSVSHNWKSETIVEAVNKAHEPNRPPSILKKKGSLDEKDYAHKYPSGLHSILKKHSSEDDERRSSSPDIHPILKNRNLDDLGERRPILKKRSSLAEEPILRQLQKVDFPKPILKKNLNIEGRPKPILKSKKSEDELWPTLPADSMARPRANSSDTGIKSILKKVGTNLKAVVMSDSTREKIHGAYSNSITKQQSRRVSLESGMISNLLKNTTSSEKAMSKESPQLKVQCSNRSNSKGLQNAKTERVLSPIPSSPAVDQVLSKPQFPLNNSNGDEPSKVNISDKLNIFENLDKKPSWHLKRRNDSRYKTQPITLEEVHEASMNTSKSSNKDPSSLSIKEKLKLFAKKEASAPTKTVLPRSNRRKTEPITLSEVKKALAIPLEVLTSRKTTTKSKSTSNELSCQEENDLNYSLEAEAFSAVDFSPLHKTAIKKSLNRHSVVPVGNLTEMEETAAPKPRPCSTSGIEIRVEKYTESITERLNRLSQNAEENWKRKIEKSKEEEMMKPESIAQITHRLSKLEEAQEKWRLRVEESDAVQFTVAGKMSSIQASHSPLLDRKRAIPNPVKFSGKTESLVVKNQAITIHTKVSAERTVQMIQEKSFNRVKLMKVDDDATFGSFFSQKRIEEESVVTEDCNFEDIFSTAKPLQVQKKFSVNKPRKIVSKNPLKVLASRDDIVEEYLEPKHNNDTFVHQLTKRCEGLALSALAGLASNEDFTGIALKKLVETCPPLLPQKDLMLLQVKGRRHVQTRLVQPTVEMVNQGDTYVLVTPSRVFHYAGPLSNVIECSKGAEVAAIIQANKDLCFTGDAEVVNCTDPCHELLKQLSCENDGVMPAGPPSEDEAYEQAMIDTTKVYRVEGAELVPHPACWGCLPSISLLLPEEVLVFDFGGELYTWLGKQAPFNKRKIGLELSRQMWDAGYNYEECGISPLDLRSSAPLKEAVRPSWALIAKINQHMEPVLFREKFTDWPDLYNRLIKMKTQNPADAKYEELQPYDVKDMVEDTLPEPDLILEGSHLGRGPWYFDKLNKNEYETCSLGVKVWLVREYESVEVDNTAVFYSGDTYVIRWQYVINQLGRQLTGQRSRYSFSGRERCVYFFWQGKNSTVTEKGASALMTVELDAERGPHVRVVQGSEPPRFLSLFEGKLTVVNGKQSKHNPSDQHGEIEWRLFLVKGEFRSEATLEEVSCSGKSLRSKGCFILLGHDRVFLWQGCQASSHMKNVANCALQSLTSRPQFLNNLKPDKCVKELNEGDDDDLSEFWSALGPETRVEYKSLVTSDQPHFPPRLFHLSGVLGVFKATQVACPWWTKEHDCTFSIGQAELYSTGLALVDSGSVVYLWQGVEGGNWRSEWQCALTTALLYSQHKGNHVPCYLVWAGLEPLEFTNLFPQWTCHEELVELGLKFGRRMGEMQDVAVALQEFTRAQYTLDELKQLPEGVDPTRLESYLHKEEFEKVIGLNKENFYELPSWKQSQLKQAAGLF